MNHQIRPASDLLRRIAAFTGRPAQNAERTLSSAAHDCESGRVCAEDSARSCKGDCHAADCDSGRVHAH